MDHASARNSNEGCFVGREPLTRCCASATYAAGVYRVGLWCDREITPRYEDEIDVDDLTTFVVLV